MRILLVSDLHLDTAFGWAGPALGEVLRANLRATLDRIAALARQSRADALLCGGDLFDQARATPKTLDHLRTSFAELEVPVHLTPGDDDWYGPSSPYRQVDWSPNVHVFTEARLTPVTVEDGLTLWGAAHDSPASTGGFLDGFRVDRAGVNLALFHGCETGTTAAAVPYAPFRAEQVEAAGLDHALLGHVHTPVDHAQFTYPGNPCPLTPGETGPRGAVLVAVGDDGAVERTRYDVAGGRVHEVSVDVTGASHSAEMRERVEEAVAGLAGVVRVTVHGALAPSVDLADLTGLGQDDAAHLDGLVLRQGQLDLGHDLDALAGERTVRGQFVRDVRADSSLDEETRTRVLLAGLRALDGRTPEPAVG
ncbi:metallophosphoesterase family protein [Pseudonocardia charpentierae]|uniref:Metallophosphoesterase family protein n=1 Tax=Pseudonocardia charpentierae TaxID=3075545 RepID=A0ABU2N4G5_9PSEU|nr:metallophosphoesterase [Pseudonocardia sp. DSM 45834]MDT0348209.1 metallophosphoesterase family protein [Pseudonocardia sp. DSM 45834]